MTDKHKERKRQIIEATFSALKSGGLPSLSYDRIAEHGAFSRQVIRYHYQTSDALMIDLCDFVAAKYRETLIAGIMKLEGPARLELFLDFYFDLLDDMPKPRDDQVYDALMSLSAGSPKVRTNLRQQYSLLGQVLSHEFEVQYPNLGTQSAKELSYLFVNLMYGHWKMVASLGLSENHKHIARQAMDRLIESYRREPSSLREKVDVWTASPET